MPLPSPKRPLLWLGLAFMAGIILADQLHLSVPVWLGLSALALLAAFLIYKRISLYTLPGSTRLLLGLIFLSLAIGGLRYQTAQPEFSPGYVAWYNDQDHKVTLTGWLIAPPDQRDEYTNLRLHLDSLDTAEKSLPVQGQVLVRTLPGADFKVGDVLRMQGYLKTPPENEEFSYRAYLARQGIHSILYSDDVSQLPFRSGSPIIRAVFTFKDHLFKTLKKIFPEPEASLLAGILLGVDHGLSPGLQQAFNNTGTAHIIAISGFNIAILAAFFAGLFGRLLGSRRGALVAILGIAFYTLLVGADASVLRSAIMGGSALFARQIGRRQDGLNTLGLVAGLMCVFNPFLPWDVGFQLSFAATLGLVLYAGPLQEFVLAWLSTRFPQAKAQKLAAPLAEYLLFTLAAQVTTLPLMAYHFGRISLVSFLANPFILPAQPAVMIASGLALLLGLINLPLGQLAAWLAWPFSTYTIRVVELFNRFPHGVLVLGDFSLLFVVLFYLLLFGFTFAPARLKEILSPVRNPLFLGTSMVILTVLVWRSALSLPDGRLHLTFLDVGSADAVLIQTPTGRNLLINGGPTQSGLTDALGRRLSPLERKLDILVLASTQEEQVASLPGTMQLFPPDVVLWSGSTEASYSSLRLQAWLVSAEIPVTVAEPGLELDLGQGARLKVLTVSSRGAVLMVEWIDFRALLPIGLTFADLETMPSDPTLASLSVLLLADSGYAPLNPPQWISKLDPQLSILSVSAADPNGLPDQETLAAVQNYPLIRTDRSGWINVSTDGVNMWVETER
ncbi:MAG: ComEC/Rec2 family competence protein [Chloroflexota bacterium]